MAEIKEIKEVTTTKEVIVGFKCDACGIESTGPYMPEDWHHFKTGHGGWGNDSFESIIYFDVCTPNCYIGIMGREVIKLTGKEDGSADGMTIPFAANLIKAYFNDGRPL